MRPSIAKNRFLVYGDFDVDGQTGTSILMLTLRHLGAKVSFYIPDRDTEGHGLNSTAVCRLVSTRQIKLLITTDTGITDFNEVSLLTGLGVDTIVTDHHSLPENLPLSLANVNPRCMDDPTHPMFEMCGAGVAFKLCELLLEARGESAFAESLLDIAAIGTVVDMMPLTRENRWLVWRGLQVLNQRNRVGINALLEQAGTPADKILTSETLGFVIGPRLNALGRLERADDGVELLTTTDPERSRAIALRLEALNRKRQEMCDETLMDAERYLSAHGGLDGHRTIILASPQWHPGIIGLVATRLKDRYNVPILMMIIDEDAGTVRCSARSIPKFHLHDQLQTLQHYFLHFGGHAGAGGFALKLDKLAAFKRDFYALADAAITDDMMRPVIDVDSDLDWSQLNTGLIDLMQALEPVGQANPAPVFAVKNVTVSGQKRIGEGGKHLKLLLKPGNPPPGSRKSDTRPLEALIWRYGAQTPLLATDEPYHVVVDPEENTFRGDSKVQLIIRDYRLASGAANPVAVETAAPAASAATATLHRSTISTTPASSGPESPAETTSQTTDDGLEASQPNWIDHRSRDGVDAFVGQLMLPLQSERPVLLYHEGTALPDIPFLDAAICCTRQTARPTPELILWDLPPDAAHLHALLKAVQPRTLHWVGGKFTATAMAPAPRDVLKQLYQAIRELAKPATTPVSVAPHSLAITLGVTEQAVLQGLVLLSRMTLIAVELPTPGTSATVQIQLLPANGNKRDVNQYLELLPFQQTLADIAQYRTWLMTAPLVDIRQSLRVMPGVSGVSNESTQPPVPAAV